MRGSNEAEVVIAFRAENEASAELEDIRNEAREADRGFQGLDRSVIATGLGFLGLGFGAKEAIQNFQDFNQAQGQIQARLDLLGPAAQQAFNDLKPAFKGIADTVAATELEVAEAFSIIIANSGGIAPSATELAGAFDIARAKGIGFADAAALIGKALQGNLDPLQTLLDPSERRSIPSLAEGLDRVRDSSRDSITEIDRLSASFRSLGDSMSEAFKEDPADFIADLTSGISPLIAIVNELRKAFETPDPEVANPKLITPTPEEYTSALGLAQGSGVVGNRGIGEQAQQLVFNISIGGQSLDPVVILLEQGIRNNNRNGINVSTP